MKIFLFPCEDWIVHRAKPRWKFLSHAFKSDRVLELCPLFLKIASLSLRFRKYLYFANSPLGMWAGLGVAGLEITCSLFLLSVFRGFQCLCHQHPLWAPVPSPKGSNNSRNPSQDTGVSSEVGEISLLLPLDLWDLTTVQNVFSYFVGMSCLFLCRLLFVD